MRTHIPTAKVLLFFDMCKYILYILQKLMKIAEKTAHSHASQLHTKQKVDVGSGGEPTPIPSLKGGVFGYIPVACIYGF